MKEEMLTLPPRNERKRAKVKEDAVRPAKAKSKSVKERAIKPIVTRSLPNSPRGGALSRTASPPSGALESVKVSEVVISDVDLDESADSPMKFIEAADPDARLDDGIDY
jgi:hypothetical protein